jgi:hypothetical protein
MLRATRLGAILGATVTLRAGILGATRLGATVTMRAGILLVILLT